MTCLVLLSLSGCASVEPVDIPDWDLTPATVEIQRQARLPEFPSPASNTEETVTFTVQQFAVITEYLIVAGGNYDIGVQNEQALEDLSRSYNHLIEAGKLQNQFTQIREEQLARERSQRLQDQWFYRGVIVLGLLAGASL